MQYNIGPLFFVLAATVVVITVLILSSILIPVKQPF